MRAKQANGRADWPSDGQEETLANALHRRLRTEIAAGRLDPGARLDEQEMAERHGCSRTPVREALRLLAAEGLVELRGRQGAAVRALDLPQLIEMFQVMAELEGLCARLAARRAIFERLCRDGELTVGALTAQAGVSQPAVSKHLGVLKQAGLVRDRQAGRQTHYSAQLGALSPLIDWTSQMAGFWEARFDDLENLLARMDQ